MKLGIVLILELKKVLSFIDSLQKEPKKCMYSMDAYTDEDRKVLCDGCKEECKYNKSDDFTKVLAECINQAKCNTFDSMVLAELWKDELIKLAKNEEPVSEQNLSNVQRFGKNWKEPVSEDLEEAAKHYLYSNILYDDVYVGNPTDKDCIEMFKAGAKWQKQQIMKDAVEVKVKVDAGGYPYVDRVIELYDYEKDIPLAKAGDKVKLLVLKDG